MSLAWRLAALMSASLAGATTAALRQPENPAAAMARAATAFLESPSPEHRAVAAFAFAGDERLNWHFIPTRAEGRPGVVRKGLPFKAMNPQEHRAALALLGESLSQSGYEKVATVRVLEMVLLEAEKDAPYVPPGAQRTDAADAAAQSPAREPDLYYFQIFGTPSATGPWSWRYEGHHVSHTWTIQNGRLVASTPQFLGASPAEVRSGSRKGLRTLAKEEDLARMLLMSLTPGQRARAIVSDAPPIRHFTWNDRRASRQEDVGIAYADLAESQRQQLVALIDEYASVQPGVVAQERLARIQEAGLDSVRFAWMGPAERGPGKGHYYRVQGPTFIIEYDNTQNDANHIHTAWRDFTGDFGIDLLARHYLSDHQVASAAQ